MPLNDPLPPPVSMIAAPVRVVDMVALRAALRLALDPADADEAASRLPNGGDHEDLGLVGRDALGRARMERWLARLPWRSSAEDRMLGAASGAPAEAAIALALGIGLGLDGRDLADALDTRVELVGEWLVAGRRALDPEMPDPCRKTAWLVGRYEDRSLDPDERVELLTHLNRCPICQEVVERSRVVDAAIAAKRLELWETVATQPVAGVTRLERTRRSAVVVGITLLALLLLVGGGTIAARLFGGPDEPVPLVVAKTPATRGGWLVMARADGSVQARHLDTGVTRRILAPDDPVTGISQLVSLSPDGTRLMTYVGEYSQSSRSRVVVNGLDGAEIGRVEWAGENMMFYPTGWVDERHILVSVFPIFRQGQTSNAFVEQYATESRLLVVDIETGEQREMLRGNVYLGLPSPDGRYVAVARLTDREAVLSGRNGFRIEIWPIEPVDGAGPILTLDQPVATGPGLVWAGDGSRIFLTQAIGDADGDPGSDQEGRAEGSVKPHRLVAIDLDGDTIQLAEGGDDSTIYPVSAAPDGSSVVYALVEGANVMPVVSYWRVRVDGTTPERLSDAVTDSHGGPGVVWGPDGATVLMGVVTVPYLEQNGAAGSRSTATATEIVAVDTDGNRTTMLSSFSIGDRLLGWLPDEALPRSPREQLDSEGTYSEPEPVLDVPDGARLADASAASSDGNYLTLDDVEIGSPLLWRVGTDDTQRLRASIEDAVWLPAATGLLSVSGERESVRPASHLAVLASTTPYAPLILEPRQFDPVGMDSGDERVYAMPRVAPDGLNTSFFVIDTERGHVELWIANRAGGASVVTGWNLPPERIIEPPLVSTWVDDRTLVFAQPDAWSDGMPESAALKRVTVGEDGQATVEDVIELSGRGEDRGVALTELAISADGDDIAWRLRHYTRRASDDGRIDSVHLAPTGDVSRDVEVTRGSPGSGLAWSSDGRHLLIGIDGEVAVADAGDLGIEVISGADRAAGPLWVGQDEIWYSAGAEHRVMRVRVE